MDHALPAAPAAQLGSELLVRRGRPESASSYLPQMLVATTLVTLVPAFSAWWLRRHGTLRSAAACLLFCLLLSIGLSITGAAYWKRRRHSADIMFSELLVWGWVRRLWRERELRNVPALVESAVSGNHSDQLTVERRRRMLTQLAEAIEARDPYIDGHSRRVARHSGMIAAKMKLPAEDVARIRTAAALHDVGKLSTPSEVLSKPGRLTDQEFEVVKRHAQEGALMVACLEDPELTAIVECHHERMDGSGYPGGLEAEAIPLGARIVAVADVFDAITAPRPYRPAAPHQRAFAVLSSEEGTRLDPDVVHIFIRCYSGGRSVAWWAALSALAASAIARSRGLLARWQVSLRDFLNTVAAVTAAAVAAVAAPVSAQVPHHLPPARSAVASASTAGRPATHTRRVLRRRSHHRATAANIRAGTPAQLTVRHRSPAARPASPQATGHDPPARPTTTTRHRPPGRRPVPKQPPSNKPPPNKPPPKPPPTTTTTPTTTAPPEPTSKQQCMSGGWAQFGFPNQGQCIDWVVHHDG